MKHAEISDIFERFSRMKILVIGDVMVDSYVWGKVDRISPEAPVPVVSVKTLEKRPGGAANVALNLKSLGAEPYLLASVGKDRSGDEFLDLIDAAQMPLSGLVRIQRTTTVKTRILGNSHHLLRVDEEDDRPFDSSETAPIIDRFRSLVKHHSFDAVIFEDYDKGLITRELIEVVTEHFALTGVPVCVDPKKRNFANYKQVDLFKPNLKEIREGLKISVDSKNLDSLKEADQQLRETLDHRISLITLSEEGVYVTDKLSQVKIPAHLRNITDVSGAGDTVISVATLCMAAGLSKETMAEWSNLAGGLTCEKVGVVPVDKDQLIQEILRIS